MSLCLVIKINLGGFFFFFLDNVDVSCIFLVGILQLAEVRIKTVGAKNSPRYKKVFNTVAHYQFRHSGF